MTPTSNTRQQGVDDELPVAMVGGLDGAAAQDVVARQEPRPPEGQALAITPTGHYRGSTGIDEHIVYTALLDDGSQLTLTPADFAQRFGWKNDATQVPDIR